MKKCLGAIFLLCSLVVWAIPVSEVPNPRERDGSWVSDTASVLSPTQTRAINERIDRLQATNGSEIAVVTVADTTPLKPKAYATQLFNRWGVGDSEDNSGVLILVVMGQRRIEIEVGTGANRYLTDADCSQILQANVIPYFKQGKPGDGVVAAVVACADQLEPVDYAAAPPEPVAAAQPLSAPRPVRPASRPYSPPPDPPYALYVGAAVLVLILILIFRRYLRNRPRRCPGCHLEMMRLGESEDDEFLAAGQIDEEGLGSVDYDVWICRACDRQKVVAYSAWFSGFRRCSSCSYRCEECTGDVVLSHATYYSSGHGRRDYYCRHCGRRRSETYTIPQKTQSTTSSSSGFSSSSSSSFGGGSSSGGGAGGSW
ncbi:MAG: YgcG family protein [Vulcanimicrobiota bacterium]